MYSPNFFLAVLYLQRWIELGLPFLAYEYVKEHIHALPVQLSNPVIYFLVQERGVVVMVARISY
jgi:hypothetical protein